ncbi:hypothetical protein F2P81_002731 [Scophthalmus maximus]|uniref:Uncharacterized protein n=1 Tax=Scophthalmus maximus TaxID=52904 RepID=A0A6A4TVY4_SCOMX|nr:hypothetical protein F2P81_002731 [Scophthalmus maximus]
MFCSRERAALRTRALRGLVSSVIREQPLRNVYDQKILHNEMKFIKMLKCSPGVTQTFVLTRTSLHFRYEFALTVRNLAQVDLQP